MVQPAHLIAQETAKSNPEKGSKEQNEIEISPVEDLMREHGALARILLIYNEIILRLNSGKEFPADVLVSSTGLIRQFIEEYHEKLEEDHLFPRFEKAGKLVDLVKILLQQHQAGRRLTDPSRGLAVTSVAEGSRGESRTSQIFGPLHANVSPPQSPRDTVLFPSFRSIVSPKEFDSLGEAFEDKEEEELFGKDGFEKIVNEVEKLERRMGVYDLSQFTANI